MFLNSIVKDNRILKIEFKKQYLYIAVAKKYGGEKLMERRLYDLNQMLRDNIPCDDCQKTQRPMGMIPDCINTDYCVESPKNMNNGILTMAFVDIQPLDTVYPNETAYSSGTLFPNLDKPFYGGMKR